MRIATLLLLLLSTLPALADERILDYRSDIEVHTSGVLTVTENIVARGEGEQIRHGIYRDFPTLYESRYGVRQRVTFALLTAELDGQPIAHSTKYLRNGVRVYIGDEHRLLSPGEHRYTLTYRTDYQLGYFDDHDELYWNVTGNSWSFPIDHVEATVRLPQQVPVQEITQEAYTGAYGDKGQDYTSQMEANGTSRFDTTVALPPHEGLTIVVGWPKGYVYKPTNEERLRRLWQDNANLIVGVIGLALLLLYYGLVWRIYGRDPESGVIIPRYEPPHGFSPASSRFISRMGYDNKAFTAALVNLAVKRLIVIEQEGDNYTLTRLHGANPPLAAGERVLLSALFRNGDTVELKKSEHVRVGNAMQKHKSSLKRDYEKLYFNTNGIWVIPGILISIAVMVVSARFAPTRDEAYIPVFMTVWLSFWTFAVYALGKAVFNAWRDGVGSGIGITLFATPFFLGELFGLWMLFTQGGPGMAMVLISAMGINVLFYQLLKAPTRAGRKLLDELEGFRLYLEVAEKDEMNLRNPPEKTPQLFEAYLPYALALDVEQQWAERFANVFAKLDAQQTHYQPSWYRGSNFNSAAIGSFAGALGGSLTSVVTSASTAPGSSSGGGGGGFSGGGGGGGGGGGW